MAFSRLSSTTSTRADFRLGSEIAPIPEVGIVNSGTGCLENSNACELTRDIVALLNEVHTGRNLLHVYLPCRELRDGSGQTQGDHLRRVDQGSIFRWSA